MIAAYERSRRTLATRVELWNVAGLHSSTNVYGKRPQNTGLRHQQISRTEGTPNKQHVRVDLVGRQGPGDGNCRAVTPALQQAAGVAPRFGSNVKNAV
jgi:hypothetical protein